MRKLPGSLAKCSLCGKRRKCVVFIALPGWTSCRDHWGYSKEDRVKKNTKTDLSGLKKNKKVLTST